MLSQMLKAVAHHDKMLALAHHLRVVLVGRTILGRRRYRDIRGMSVARSHDSHAHTAHINQNAGGGYGTILQECISYSSWYACYSDFEIYCLMILSEVYNLCRIFVNNDFNMISWKNALLAF
jgi:hypothetical protein